MCWADMGRNGPFRHVVFATRNGESSGKSFWIFFWDLAQISIDLSGNRIKQMGIGRRFSWHLIMGSFQAVTTGFFPIFF